MRMYDNVMSVYIYYTDTINVLALGNRKSKLKLWDSKLRNCFVVYMSTSVPKANIT